MATSTLQKTPCAICGKVTGLFTCRGCQKDFCTRHVTEHRQELGKQMDELTLDHDRFRQNLIEQTTEPQLHPLMKEIDEWEQQSVDKIHRKADEARQQLQNTMNDYTTKLNEALANIADEVCKARDDEDFFETDLEQWLDKLDQLKKELAHPPNIKIRQEDNDIIPFIPKVIQIVSSKETFEQSIGSVQIKDNGQVIVKTQCDGYATARSNGEYTSGQHHFRIKVEEYHVNKWIFIGIISKDMTMRLNSHSSRSSYGWVEHGKVYLDGADQIGFNGYKSDIEKNDIVELFMNCDQHIIRLTNERTQSVYAIPIDISKCPFPWQLNFSLFYLNDRIRLLQT